MVSITLCSYHTSVRLSNSIVDSYWAGELVGV